ncbi:MAG: HlyC/CorC family transporter [Gammaproteobacteria bacterium]
MADIPLSVLFGALIALIVLSAFFSGSETSMMALNRYRLRHLAQQKHRGARLASALLERPDRLIGLILLGNNFVNILASALATLIALRLLGEAGIAIATGLLTLVILIFSEVAPKTMAVLHPERIAFPASYVLTPLLKLLYPLVWAVNWMANSLLRLFGVAIDKLDREKLTSDELRIVVNEAGSMISKRYKRMLLSILDLEKVSVDDIMVPRNEINGLNLEDSEKSILEQLATSQHTMLPVYRGGIDHTVGILHLRKVVTELQYRSFSKERLLGWTQEPYFVPAGTPLDTQLLNFQRHQRRIGLVVDEYGDILGLVALEDILEEIVGEFTTDPAAQIPDVYPQPDGSYLIDASASIRDLNRTMHWELPADGPKTINGLILEYLETIPEAGTSLLIAGYPVEVVQTKEHAIKTVRIQPHLRRPQRAELQSRLH